MRCLNESIAQKTYSRHIGHPYFILFSFKKPVICSDIGGMAEKISHNIDGLHFKAGNSIALAEIINYVIESSKQNNEYYDRFKNNISSISTIEATTKLHSKLYI